MDKMAPIIVRVPESQKRAIDERLGREGMKAQWLLGGWLREWLEGKKQAPALSSSKVTELNAIRYPEEHRIQHEQLDTILGDPEERGGIIANLKWGSEMVKAKRKRGHGKGE